MIAAMPRPVLYVREGCHLCEDAGVLLDEILGTEGWEAIDIGSDDELEALLHRMIVARPDLQDLHRASRAWLFKHGIDPFGEVDGRQN